ncbi:unnamed protein product [Aspergillus oryzae]|uniref:Unnamed protein product n=2 Tax=Aspergillus oryzae TaxID=5062 RepID=A0AAN5C181_ASPOZ|nr:unnamed protein product [Aspergillus oryzae]GMF89939.1 unnamed protein product [Aspergillus oryzae]GMG12204.1 unnamed protein product [Aspergillus oryzae]GMG33612.1 unnamed protein product [Aspergillus oryzae]GMG42092.1 unnamed protein product [Aspergillus oryzae var. brunneus]
MPLSWEPDFSEALKTHEVLHELVGLYFRHIHNIAHTMFHEPSFMHHMREGTASMKHVYGMCALAASGEVDHQRKHIYVGLARLHAEALSLWGSATQSSSDAVIQEEYRRTCFSVRIATHWSASDMFMEPEDTCHSSEMVPEIDDVLFHTLTSAELLRKPPLAPTFRCDMWAQMARTLDIFTKINGLLRQLSRGVITLNDYCQEAPILEDRLNQWYENLPEHLTYSYDHLIFFLERHLGRTFLSMHIGYYHFRQMLFFPFLKAGVGREATTTEPKAAKCNESAATVSEILNYATSLENCELDYFIYGHIAVVSSCVHLHSLLFSDDLSELFMARQRLILNFKFLMRVKSYWPIVDSSNSCRNSMSDPFALDNWMARFLTEHSSCLAERQTHDSLSSSFGVERISTQSAEYNAELSGIAQSSGILNTPNPGALEGSQLKEPENAWDGLSYLMNDQSITNEALADNAIDWLLKE